MDNLLSTAAEGDIVELLTNDVAVQELLKVHASDLLAKKVMRRQTGGNVFLQVLDKIVQDLISLDKSSSYKGEKMRQRYTALVCRAANAMQFETVRDLLLRHAPPAGAIRITVPILDSATMFAVVGDTSGFVDHALDIQDMFWRYEYFRNALDSAVACDHRDMVHTMLTHILTKVKEPSRTEEWTRPEIRTAAIGLFDALLVAIRLQHHQIANMILEALIQHPILSRSIPPKSRILFYEFCVYYGNIEFFSRALHYERTRTWLTRDFDLAHGDRVEPREADTIRLMQQCSKWTMRWLLKTKQLDPEYVGDNSTPIILALQEKRHDLVPLLVEAGANIDGLPRDGGQTAMSRALVSGSDGDVRLLESLGAHVEAVIIPLPSSMSKPGRPDDQQTVIGHLKAMLWWCVFPINRVLSRTMDQHH
jgi:hypothetical protein